MDEELKYFNLAKQPEVTPQQEYIIRPVQVSNTSSLVSSLFRYILFGIAILIVAILIVLLILIASNTGKIYSNTVESSGGYVRKDCKRPPAAMNSFDESLTKRDAKRSWPTSFLLTNGRTLSPEGEYVSISMLIENGKITRHQVKPSDLSNYNQSLRVVDLNNKFVTPGLVDIHSHLGVLSYPGYRAHRDYNEAVDPILPQLRAVDGINPKDPAIEILRNSGITSALVLPGSANVMGGEGAIVKLVVGNSVKEMLVNGAPKALKMSCGENPKLVYGSNNITPYSRMGIAWLLRQKLDEARRLKVEQDNWDCTTSDEADFSDRPFDLSLESLVALLRGDNTILNFHCDETQDLEAIVRLSQEFNFKISAFHHASEAYLIPDLLKENNITACLFADRYGNQIESSRASVHAPKILRENGVNVAIKTDHSISDGSLLMFNAAKTRHYGLSDKDALDSVTRVPAETLQLGNRIGSLQIGGDADVVVWDRNPLNIGATPVLVFVDGYLTLERDIPLHDTKNPLQTAPSLQIRSGNCSGTISSSSYVLSNAKIMTQSDSNDIISNGVIIVNNGNISCVGTIDECPYDITPEVLILELDGGIVVPGFVETGSYLGIFEIEKEEITSDGKIVGSPVDNVLVRDGIVMDYNSIHAAFKAGVTTSISLLSGSNVLNGKAVAFETSGNFIDETIIKSPVGLQVTIGNDAKGQSGDLSGSVAGQIALLREYLQNAVEKDSSEVADVWIQVLNRSIPIIATVQKADWISQLVSLREEFGFKLVIVGGAEAHLVAHRISNDKNKDFISVVLTPMAEGYAPGQRWDTVRSDSIYGLNELLSKGVSKRQIAIATGSSPYGARNLRFTAGFINQQSELQALKTSSTSVSWADALDMITRNPADIFELGSGYGRIVAGTAANFVLLNSNSYDHNVLTFDSRVKAVFLRNTVDCSPIQQ